MTKIGSARYDKIKWTLCLFLGSIVTYMSRSVIPISMPSIIDDLEWNKRQLSLALSSFYLGYAFSQYFGGKFADQYKSEVVILYSSLLWVIFLFATAISRFAFSVNNSIFCAFVFFRLMTGLFQGVFFPSISSFVSKNVEFSSRSFVFAAISSGTYIGNFLVSMLSSQVNKLNWPSFIFFVGLLAVVWIIFLYHSIGEVTAINDKNIPSHNTYNTEFDWSTLFKSSAFRALIFAHYSTNNCTYIIISWVPLYVDTVFKGNNNWVFNSLPWIICLPFVLLCPFISNSMTNKGYSTTTIRKCFQGCGLLGEGIFLILFCFSKNYNGALFSVAIVLIFSTFHIVGTSINPMEIAPNYAGSVYGIINIFSALSGFIGVYASGMILLYSDSWKMMFLTNAFLCISSGIVYIRYASASQII